MAQTKIQSKDLSIIELFNNNRFYVVPPFQREYVWTESIVSQFLDDIIHEFEAGKDDKDSEEYFIGSIVVCPSAKEHNLEEIIDGQQRLTTLFLILCAIRDSLKSSEGGDDTSKSIADNLSGRLRNISLDSTGRAETRYALTLQYGNVATVIHSIVDGNYIRQSSEIKAIENIENAFELVRKQLNQNGFANHSTETLRLLAYIDNKIKLIKITTEDVGTALKIFETINERGVGLNSFDLIKNRIFMHSSPENYSQVEKPWETLTRIIESMKEKPLRFIRYFILSSYGVNASTKLTESGVFDWLTKKDNVSRLGYEQKPLEFVQTLISEATKYKGYFRDDKDHTSETNFYVRSLRILGGTATRQHLMLLLAASKLSDLSEFNKLAEELEKNLFVYLLVKERSQNIEAKFIRWATNIRNLETIELNLFLESLKNDRNEFYLQFRDVFLALSASDIQKYRLKYILAKFVQHIEIKAFGKNDHTLNLSNYINDYEIEHIHPECPSDKAIEEFGKLEDDISCQKLGNLLLLEKSINASVKNHNFQSKKHAYKGSKLLLTNNLCERTTIGSKTKIDQAVSELMQFDEWNESNILKRQEMLFTLAKEIWLD